MAARLGRWNTTSPTTGKNSGRARRGFSGQVEIQRVNVRQAALEHHVQRTIAADSAKETVRCASAKHVREPNGALDLKRGNIGAKNGLFLVELVLEINGHTVPGPGG